MSAPFIGHPAGERLSEFLDGGLGTRDQKSVALHLETCTECSTTLAALRAVRDRAAALPPFAPPAELWGAIESRLGGTPAGVIDLSAERERRARRWTFSTPQLVAAAAALIVVSAAATWLIHGGGRAPASTASGPSGPLASSQVRPGVVNPPATGEGEAREHETRGEERERASSPSPATRGGTPVQNAREGAPAAPNAALADFGVERYDLAIADLERVLDQNRSRLNPATVQVVEKNLALIDRAIEEARRALAADPASPYLNDHLAATMKRKVELLRRVTAAMQS